MIPVLYHNPHCSKSRQALSLLEQRGVELQVVHYLDHPPDVATLQRIAMALDQPLDALVRYQDPAWQEAGVDPRQLADEALLDFLANHPSAMQRPILVVGDQARIGRPAERVLEILSHS